MEVVDGWLVKFYPRTPTWREIADVHVVEHRGLYSCQEYLQFLLIRLLPTEISNAVHDIQAVQNAAPPPPTTNNGGSPQTPAYVITNPL